MFQEGDGEYVCAVLIEHKVGGDVYCEWDWLFRRSEGGPIVGVFVTAYDLVLLPRGGEVAWLNFHGVGGPLCKR